MQLLKHFHHYRLIQHLASKRGREGLQVSCAHTRIQNSNNSSFSILLSEKHLNKYDLYLLWYLRNTTIMCSSCVPFFCQQNSPCFSLSYHCTHFTDRGNSGTEQCCTFLSLHTTESSYCLCGGHHYLLWGGPGFLRTEWHWIWIHQFLDDSLQLHIAPKHRREFTRHYSEKQPGWKAVTDLLPYSLSSYAYFLVYLLLENSK